MLNVRFECKSEANAVTLYDASVVPANLGM